MIEIDLHFGEFTLATCIQTQDSVQVEVECAFAIVFIYFSLSFKPVKVYAL